MSFEISSDALPAYFHIKFAGPISPHGAADLLSALISLPQWEKNTPLLIDYRNSTREHYTYNDTSMIVEIMMKYESRIGTGKCAFIVDKPQELWINRTYQFLYAKKFKNETKIFQDYDAAVKWIKE